MPPHRYRSGLLPDDAPTVEDALVECWRSLVAAAEWVCHAGIGRLFAPWDAATAREYRGHADVLRARVDDAARAGVVRPERALAMHATLAAHAAPYTARSGLEELRARDLALRDAFAPPAAVAARVRALVPAAPWPLSRFMPPPPLP